MYRRQFYLTLLTALFSMGQVWAFLVVFTTVRVDGPAMLAMSLTLAGSTVAVVLGWTHVFRQSRTHVDRLDRMDRIQVDSLSGV
jgi:hypothetical protein